MRLSQLCRLSLSHQPAMHRKADSMFSLSATSSTPDLNANTSGMDFWNSLDRNANDGGFFKISICDFINDLDALVER